MHQAQVADGFRDFSIHLTAGLISEMVRRARHGRYVLDEETPILFHKVRAAT
jgi:hypothetical protein